MTNSMTILLAVLFTCGAFAADDRLPGTHVMPSDEFNQLEKDQRQHTFIQLGTEGKFGYHVSLFLTNHQHQVIVASELKLRGKTDAQMRAILSKPAVNGYYTVLTDQPRFPLGDILTGKRKVIPVDLYDGIISIDNEKKLLPEATYEIKGIVFTTPMHVEDEKLKSNHYIIFGNTGGEQTRYFMAHLIWGASNYDQVVEIDLTAQQKIDNGRLVAVDNLADNQPLAEGQDFTGKIGDQNPISFKVVRQVHFRPLQ